MKSIHSYVPESEFYKDKQQKHSRLFHDDCAVLDVAQNYRILACRGMGIRVGDSFVKHYGISAEELNFLERALAHHKRLLISSKRGPILLFADYFLHTGALIAIFPYAKKPALLRALLCLGEAERIAFSPSVDIHTVSAEADDILAREQVEEIFFYMNGMLSPTADVGIWTRTLLLANLAGCKLDRVMLPTQMPRLTKANEERLLLFLLCSLLTLRYVDGTKFAIGRLPAHDGPYRYLTGTLSCSEKLTRKLQKTPTDSGLPFLSLPAFAPFSAKVTNGKIVLEAYVPQAARTDHVFQDSNSIPVWHLSLELIDDETAS